jgi:hypothetical protein
MVKNTTDLFPSSYDTARDLGGGTILDYNGTESAHNSRCMHAFSGQGARLPEWEESGVDTTVHHILG